MSATETAGPGRTGPGPAVGAATGQDVGAVAIVHPRLSPAAAEALRSAGFARVVDTACVEVWLRYPAE